MKVRAPLGSIARSIHFAPPLDSKYRTYIEIEIEIEIAIEIAIEIEIGQLHHRLRFPSRIGA
jgi:hypothetical protein